jgi:NitT/TauT family transport system ATP-binding protein
LSKGLCQRVSLARALVLDDVILILDEPMANLDELTREKLRYDLLEIFSLSPRTVIWVTHNIVESIQLSNSVIVLSKNPAEIVKSFEINSSYINNLKKGRLPISVEFNNIVNNIRKLLDNEKKS